MSLIPRTAFVFKDVEYTVGLNANENMFPCEHKTRTFLFIFLSSKSRFSNFTTMDILRRNYMLL